jgi:hypothetical protein
MKKWHAYFTFETPIFMSVPPKFFTKDVVHNPNSSLFFVQKWKIRGMLPTNQSEMRVGNWLEKQFVPAVMGVH